MVPEYNQFRVPSRTPTSKRSLSCIRELDGESLRRRQTGGKSFTNCGYWLTTTYSLPRLIRKRLWVIQAERTAPSDDRSPTFPHSRATPAEPSEADRTREHFQVSVAHYRNLRGKKRSQPSGPLYFRTPALPVRHPDTKSSGREFLCSCS